MPKPNFVRVRGRSVTLHVSEDELKEYSKLVTDITAYMLSVTRFNEMPSIKTIRNSILPAKIWIAKRLSQKLNEVIAPDTVTGLGLVLYTFAGYAKTEFDLVKVIDGVIHRQTFKVTLIDKSETSLIMKYGQVHNAQDAEKLANDFMDL